MISGVGLGLAKNCDRITGTHTRQLGKPFQQARSPLWRFEGGRLSLLVVQTRNVWGTRNHLGLVGSELGEPGA